MSTALRGRARATATARAVPRATAVRVLLRASFRESLRDRGLLALALGTPLVVAVLVLTVQGFLAGTSWRVQVAGPGAERVGGVLLRDGDRVEPVAGALAAPGPDVDATVVVTGGAVLVRVAADSALAAGDLRRAAAEALPGVPVRVLGPDGREVHDVTAQLLPGAVGLTVVVLAFPGTAGRVARWRRRGTLDLLTGAGGLRGPGAPRLLGLVLLPSRVLLAVPAAAVAVLGCALTGTLAPSGAAIALLAATFVLGSAACTGLGVLAAALLRPRAEVRALSWTVVALTAVFGGVLLPPSGVLPVASAVLRWSPSSVVAGSWREGLTGTPPGTGAVAGVAVLLSVLVLVLVLLRVRVLARGHRP